MASVREEIQGCVGVIRRFLLVADPEATHPEDAAGVWADLCELQRLAANGCLLFGPRVEESEVWRREGAGSAAQWMARRQGGGTRDSAADLEAAKEMDFHPDTEEALRNGDVSSEQAKRIVPGAKADPSAEKDLLEAAKHGGEEELKRKVREARAKAQSRLEEDERAEKVRKSRFLKTWTDDLDGALRGSFKLPADDGARLLAALRPFQDQVFDEARQAGVKERSDQYAADALVAMADAAHHGGGVGGGESGGSSRPGRAPATILFRVDLSAFLRGWVESGELCEIAGIGPVPVDTAKAVLSEAFLKLVITDGVDIRTVAHLGRAVSAHVRSALEARDPVCVVPGCGVAQSLEIDHWQFPFAEGGPTELWNLARICHRHHTMKTYQQWTLTGGPGQWTWHRPDPPPAQGSDPDPPPDRADPAWEEPRLFV